MKLKYKFFMIFALMATIPLLLISYFAYNRYTSLINSQMDQVSENLAENAVSYTNAKLRDISHITDIFTFYSESHDSIVENLKKYSTAGKYNAYDVYMSNKSIKFTCQNLIYSSDYINGIFVFTPSGITLGYGFGDSIDIKPEYDVTDTDWYQTTLQAKGKAIIDGPSEKAYLINASPSITFCQALYDAYSHEFLGILIIDCAPSIFDLHGVNTMPENVLLSVDGPNNQILYSNINELPADFSNQSTRVLKKDLSIAPLTLSATVNYDALYNEFGKSRSILIAFSLICAVIFIIVSFVLSSSVTKPITFLSQHMSKYKSNDYIVNRKFLNRTDEIGVLFNEYNSMLQELESYIKSEYQNKLITLDSQMKSLEAQINSHFLYNTLESINSIAEIEGVESISIMSQALGNMFRYSIKTQSELVALNDELNHVKDYLSIQKIRFSDKFRVGLEIPSNLYQTKVLKLILQPIVENALYHGLNYCASGNFIKIRIYEAEKTLYIEVTDNGRGMSKKDLTDLQNCLNEPAQFKELGHRNKQSIGLKNIQSRIALYYGQSYGLSVASAPNIGTTVSINIPIY